MQAGTADGPQEPRVARQQGRGRLPGRVHPGAGGKVGVVLVIDCDWGRGRVDWCCSG
jgi:hypothetical protein